MAQGPKPRVSVPVDIARRAANFAGRLWVLNLRLREGIDEASREWEEGWRGESLLAHRGIRPENVEKLTKQSRFVLNELGQAYMAPVWRYVKGRKLMRRKDPNVNVGSLPCAQQALFTPEEIEHLCNQRCGNTPG